MGARSIRPPLVSRVVWRTMAVSSASVRALWQGAVSLYNSSDLTHASSIAFYGLLSLFPCLLLLLSALGKVTASDQDRAEVIGFFLRYFPRQADFVAAQVDAIQQSRVRLGVAGSLLTVWAAMGVFSAVSNAVNYAWRVERQPSYFKHKIVAFLMLIAAGVLMLCALLLVSAQNVVRASWFARVVERRPALMVLESLASRWAPTALLVGVVGLVFYFVPNTRVRFRDVWLGALLTGVLWRGGLLGFTWYVNDMSRFSVHGSIAAVVVFLLWVSYSSVILLYGAEFTAAYARIREQLMRGASPQAVVRPSSLEP